MTKNVPKYIKSKLNIISQKNRFFEVSTENKTTELVKNFYTENPFPNYNDFETIYDLVAKTNENLFMKNFKKEVGFNKSFIEVGSGTSQLALTMAYGTNNIITALDPTKTSLELGYEYAIKSGISNIDFVNADLFSDPIQKESFDVVWCSGVLHHTKDPYKGFEIISKWVKPNGIIIIGLYNKYGRFWTVMRQWLFKFSGKGDFSRNIIYKLDPYLKTNISKAKKDAWFQDQYEHPVESLHTIDEVLVWFKANNIKFLRSIPESDMSSGNYENLFESSEKGTYLSRLLSQLAMLFRPFGQEGGLFLLIGQKTK